jgi:hypothetical protein
MAKMNPTWMILTARKNRFVVNIIYNNYNNNNSNTSSTSEVLYIYDEQRFVKGLLLPFVT